MYYNYILVTSILSWCISQLIKTFINLCKTKKFDFERLFGAGGWPSAHSSMVCSASVAVGRVEGFGSTIFAVVCIFSLITMYDAMGVRRAAGQHAKEINKINRFLSGRIAESRKPMAEASPADEMNGTVMKEYLGHTPFEVASGAVIGILFAFVMPTTAG